VFDKTAIEKLIGKAQQFPALAHTYAAELDRLLRASGEKPLTFSANAWANESVGTIKLLGLKAKLKGPVASKDDKVILTAEALMKEGKRSDAFAHAFAHATGPQVNALNLFYANHVSQSPSTRLHYLSKYLSAYDLGITLKDATADFFQRITSTDTPTKVDGPLVTVIMPAHNAESTIELALGSLLNQSWRNLQIIVVDDASTDGTLQKAKELAKRDRRIEVLSSPVNAGPYVCRNLGLLHARGKWLTVHDADDWAFPDRIERQVKTLMDGNTLACTGNMLRMNAQGQITRPAELGLISIDGYQRLCFSSLMIETELFRQKLGAWDSVWVGADAEMLARIELLQIGLSRLDRPLMCCLDASQSLTNNFILGLFDEKGNPNELRKAYKKAYQAWHQSEDVKKLKVVMEQRVFQVPDEIDVRIINQPSLMEFIDGINYEVPEGVNAISYSQTTLDTYKGQIFESDKTSYPLVSIVMTTHNSVDTIESAIVSVLFQSWPNLEVVVCDDRSSDSTWKILCDLRDRHPKCLKIIKLECNVGTYLAKNVAIANSSGEYIFFQDSDDFSHPDRVRIQVLPLLNNSEIIATRTKYCRFKPSTGNIVPVNGYLSKFGLITLAVRRRAFSEIGYFEAVRKAGDDEWFQRLQHSYGKAAILNQDVTLYLAILRENSLANDIIKFNEDGSVEQNSSIDRSEYVGIFQARFADVEKRRSWYKSNFPIFPKRALDIYPHGISSFSYDNTPIYASVCSIPSRVVNLQNVVKRILPQVDHLFVYLDKFHEVPNFLLGNESITIVRSDHCEIDYRDNAKFLQYDRLKRESNSFYYITLDDDLDYPYDYVLTLIDRIELFNRSAVVGVHGVVLEDSPSGYFRRRFVYHFKSSLPNPSLVNNLGTGTVAFHSDLFQSLDPRKWPTGGMVDIFFSLEAKKLLVPMVCIDRSAGWLCEQKMPVENPTLFNEFQKKDAQILEQIMPFAPWGYRSILAAVNNQPLESRVMLSKLLPVFGEQLRLGENIGRLR